MNSLERRTVQRLIDQAHDLGVADKIPGELVAFAAGTDCHSSGGARQWVLLNPDDDEPRGCCWGEVNNGQEGCLCWVPVWNGVQVDPVMPDCPDSIRPRDGMCGDCAVPQGQPGTLRQAHRADFARAADGGAGVLLPRGHAPAGSVDGTPGMLCAGWAHRVERLEQERLAHPAWLEDLVDMQARGEILPGGMVWEDPPVKKRGGEILRQRKGLPSTRSRKGFSRRVQLKPPSGAPTTPLPIRYQILALLRSHPGRWARVYTGGWDGACALAFWYRTSIPGSIDSATRRDSLMVTVYTRYLAPDVIG